jgi:hypothetical protein
MKFPKTTFPTTNGQGSKTSAKDFSNYLDKYFSLAANRIGV